MVTLTGVRSAPAPCETDLDQQSLAGQRRRWPYAAFWVLTTVRRWMRMPLWSLRSSQFRLDTSPTADGPVHAAEYVDAGLNPDSRWSRVFCS